MEKVEDSSSTTLDLKPLQYCVWFFEIVEGGIFLLTIVGS